MVYGALFLKRIIGVLYSRDDHGVGVVHVEKSTQNWLHIAFTDT